MQRQETQYRFGCVASNGLLHSWWMVRWIDTSCMVADSLTKRMRSDRLSECLRSCWLDLITTDESVLCKMKKQKGRTSPDGNAGDIDRNDYFGQNCVSTRKSSCGMKSLRSDTLTMRVTGVRIAVFSSAIVIDVIVHCHTAGALFESKRQKTIVPIIVLLGFWSVQASSKSHRAWIWKEVVRNLRSKTRWILGQNCR